MRTLRDACKVLLSKFGASLETRHFICILPYKYSIFSDLANFAWLSFARLGFGVKPHYKAKTSYEKVDEYEKVSSWGCKKF